MLRILAISGSLRASSSNTAALQAAAKIAPGGTEIVLYRGLGELPPFNPDLDAEDPPKEVQALRHEIAQSHGLLICSPEYAHGIAGSLKNMLDWLVSSEVFPGKHVALINASPRATHAQEQLREVLRTMSADLVEDACIPFPLLGRNLDAEGIVSDEGLAQPLSQALENFAKAIRPTVEQKSTG